jgi:hypothetical protein
MPLMRGFVLALPVLLAACAGPLVDQAAYSVSGTGAPSPAEFGVTALRGEAMPANYATFNRRGEEAADFRARSICTLGYAVVNERTVPFDPGELLVRQVRCQPYILSAPLPTF